MNSPRGAVSAAIGLLASYVAHFAVAQRTAIAVFVAVFIGAEVVLRALVRYYTPPTNHKPTSLQNVIGAVVFAVLLLLLVFWVRPQDILVNAFK